MSKLMIVVKIIQLIKVDFWPTNRI